MFEIKIELAVVKQIIIICTKNWAKMRKNSWKEA